MNRYFLPFVATLILIPIMLLGLREDRDLNLLPSQFIGKPAPTFDLPTLRDARKRISEADLKGEISLVNIWATWCVGCRAEHQFLMELSQEKGIPIYAINWRDDRDNALNWLGQLGDPYVASGFDGDGRVGIDWGAYGAPETFLLNAEGHVVYRFTGPLSPALWDQEFVPRIAELTR